MWNRCNAVFRYSCRREGQNDGAVVDAPGFDTAWDLPLHLAAHVFRFVFPHGPAGTLLPASRERAPPSARMRVSTFGATSDVSCPTWKPA